MFSPFRIFLHNRLRQRLAALRQRKVIGRRPAIEGLAEGLHALRHREVANSHLAQIIVHIVAKMVEQPLRQGRYRPPPTSGAATTATNAAEAGQNGR